MLKLEQLQTSAAPRAPLTLQYKIPATMTWNQTAFTWFTTKFHHSHRHHPIPIATPVSSSSRYLSTKKPPASPTVWKTLRAPVLLGVGVYFGFMIFGKHQETKQRSAYFEALRYLNWGQGDVQEHDKREDERWKWVIVNRDVARLKRSELSNASGKTKTAGFLVRRGKYHSTMISSQDSSRLICHEEEESWTNFVGKEWWMVEWCKITVTSQYIMIEWRPKTCSGVDPIELCTPTNTWFWSICSVNEMRTPSRNMDQTFDRASLSV